MKFMAWMALATCCGAVAGGETLISFDRTADWTVAEGRMVKGATPQLVRTPDGLHFAVDTTRQKKPCLRYVLNGPARAVRSGTVLRLIVKFDGEGGLLNGTAGVRVADASGEVFHYFPCETVRTPEGLSEFTYRIDAKATPIHWGGNGNGAFDADTVTFQAVTFSIDAGASVRDGVELLKLETVTVRNMSPLVRLDVETGGVLPLIRDAVATPTLVLTSMDKAPRRWRGELQVRDFFRRGTALPIDVTLPPGGAVRVPLARPTAKGVWKVGGRLTADGVENRVATSFAVLPPRKPTPKKAGFRMGVNFHSYRGYGEADRKLAEEALVAIGAKLVRGSVCNFRQVEPKDGVWNWEKSDRIVKELEDLGIGIHSIVYSPPAWAIPEATRKRVKGKRHATDACPRLDAYAEYLRRIAERYGTRLDYYEIGNEWDALFAEDVMSVDEGVALQRLAAKTIKAACPAACVIHNGWTAADFGENNARTAAVDRFMREARGSYDRHAIHIHGSFGDYERQLDEAFFPYRKKTGLDGAVPWYSDETAHSSGVATEACVAQTVWKKILHAQAMGSVDYIWYNLRAWGPDESERGYGLVDRTFHPRLAYGAFSALEGVIGGCVPEGPPERTASRHVYRLGGVRNGVRRRVVAGWDVEPDAKPLSLSCPTDGRATLVDLMGNETPLTVRDCKVDWPIGRVPSAVVITLSD